MRAALSSAERPVRRRAVGAPVRVFRSMGWLLALAPIPCCGASDFVDPPVLVSLRVQPADTTVGEGASISYRSIGTWSDGRAQAAPASWSTTGGAIDQAGLYRATGGPGVFEVEARSATGPTGKATVTVTAPLPPPPPPPPPGVVAECAAPKPGWIWCDDFEQNRLASYFEVDPAAGSFVRASGVGVGGSWGMRAAFKVGQVSAGSLKLAFGRTPAPYFKPVDAGTADHRDVYWRVFLRTMPGWTGGGGDKLSRITAFASGGWAQAMIGHVWSSGAGSRFLAIDPASGTDVQGNLRTTKYNDFDNLRWLGIVRGNTPLFGSGYIGRWVCVEARVRLNDPGAANGVFELWLDGSLEARSSGLNWLGTYSAYGLNAVLLENYWNAGSPAAQERYFDNFVVSTSPIGC